MSRILAMFATAALLLTGCTADPTSYDGREGSQVDAAVDATRAPMPQGRSVVLRPDEPTGGLVVYVHGKGETPGSFRADRHYAPTVKALLEAGYVVAATEAGGDAWGNPASVEAYEQLVAAIPHERLYVIGQSMGGLAAMQLADRLDVRALALVYPVCDLGSMYAGRYRESIADAWGDDLERGLAELSPVVPRRPIPIRAWASPDDTVVDSDDNTQACAAVARRRGSEVEVTETVGEHGDASNFDAAGVMGLFESA